MKKPLGKKPRKQKKDKEDSKQDLIFAKYLVEDISAYESLIPKKENDPIADDKIAEVLEAVNKIKVRSESFSTAFRAKYDSVRFNKVQSICKAFLRSGKENPRFRYSFLLKELAAAKAEIIATIDLPE